MLGPDVTVWLHSPESKALSLKQLALANLSVYASELVALQNRAFKGISQ